MGNNLLPPLKQEQFKRYPPLKGQEVFKMTPPQYAESFHKRSRLVTTQIVRQLKEGVERGQLCPLSKHFYV